MDKLRPFQEDIYILTMLSRSGSTEVKFYDNYFKIKYSAWDYTDRADYEITITRNDDYYIVNKRCDSIRRGDNGWKESVILKDEKIKNIYDINHKNRPDNTEKTREEIIKEIEGFYQNTKAGFGEYILGDTNRTIHWLEMYIDMMSAYKQGYHFRGHSYAKAIEKYIIDVGFNVE